ncbi:MAG: hypothetical protein HY360_15985 [Verrucomicrobia bacterium]|nr:hypothetical protein [Verrucomicrobiota bacterium]
MNREPNAQVNRRFFNGLVVWIAILVAALPPLHAQEAPKGGSTAAATAVPTTTPSAGATTLSSTNAAPGAPAAAVPTTVTPAAVPTATGGGETPPAAAAAPSGGAGEAPAVDKPKKQLVLDFKDVELRDILQLMAKQLGKSLILPDDVKGKITARLVEVPVEKAMKILLESKGYSLSEEDGVLRIKSKVSISEEPTVSEVYQFANAPAKEAKATVDKLLTKSGNSQLDERSNTLILTDVPTNLKKVLEIIKSTLDSPIKQVMIEARLLETQRNPTLNLGMQWSSSFSSTMTPASGVVTYDGQNGFGWEQVRSAQSQVYSQTQTTGGTIPGTFSANVPILGIMTMPTLTATLNLLMADTETELLGNPKIITADNKEAKITIAEDEPIPSFGFNSATATFGIQGFTPTPIGNILTVTPHVNREDFITMDIEPEVSSRGADRTFPLNSSTAGGSVSIPVISRRTLKTRVTLKDGHTLALGGLLAESAVRNYNKVPVLGDLPLVGELFSNRSYSKLKRNLLIFITPTVIQPGTQTGLEDQYARLKDVDENDRFAYKKSFIGNAKPRDQFRTRSVEKRPDRDELIFDADEASPAVAGPVKPLDFDTQENLIHAKLMLRETERLFSQGEYATALTVCQDAEKKLRGIPGSAMELARCRQYQSVCLLRVAIDAYNQRDYPQAGELAKKAYELDPRNREAFLLQQKAAKAAESSAANPTVEVVPPETAEPATETAPAEEIKPAEEVKPAEEGKTEEVKPGEDGKTEEGKTQDKEEAMKEASAEKDKAADVNPEKLTPKLEPGLRE